MPDTLLGLTPGGSWSWLYSKNQMAILALLTRVNRPHHQVTGFDQVMEIDRARHSAQFGQDDRPLRREADLGHGGHGPANEDT